MVDSVTDRVRTSFAGDLAFESPEVVVGGTRPIVLKERCVKRGLRSIVVEKLYCDGPTVDCRLRVNQTLSLPHLLLRRVPQNILRVAEGIGLQAEVGCETRVN